MRQPETGLHTQPGAVLTQLFQDRRVVRRINDDAGMFIILGCGPEHRRPAYIDVFDRIAKGAVGSFDGCLEGVQVHDNQVYGRDVQLFHDGVIKSGAAEQAAVDLRVQGFYPAVHDLRKPGVVGYVRDLDVIGPEQAERAAGGEHGDAHLLKFTAELRDAGFVRDADQRAPNMSRHFLPSQRTIRYFFNRPSTVPRFSPRACAARVTLPLY